MSRLETNDTKIDTCQRVTASHADSRWRNPLIVPSWTYLLQVHGIIAYDRDVRTNTRGLATFKLETLTLNDYSGLTQTPRNLI